MKTAILWAIIFCQSFSAKAQTYDKMIIHNNDNLANYFTYRFPSFEEASVLFKNGGSLKNKMNFNTLLCTMQFIDPKGDTLEISKPGEIDSILFNDCTFFFRNGYFEILGTYDSVKLIVSRKASFDPVKIGAMGLPSNGNGVEPVDSYTNNAKYVREFQLSTNQDINVIEKTEYFLMISNNELIKANKANFLKIFTGDHKRIEIFLKATKPNFTDQNDLRKLFDFCTHS